MKKFQIEIEVKCPFCGGMVAAGSKPAILIHSLPTCNRFNESDADEFLRQVRLKYEELLT